MAMLGSLLGVCCALWARLWSGHSTYRNSALPKELVGSPGPHEKRFSQCAFTSAAILLPGLAGYLLLHLWILIIWSFQHEVWRTKHDIVLVTCTLLTFPSSLFVKTKLTISLVIHTLLYARASKAFSVHLMVHPNLHPLGGFWCYLVEASQKVNLVSNVWYTDCIKTSTAQKYSWRGAFT